MPPRFTTVLFDLDGTLLDSVRLILDSYHHALAVHGLAPRTDEQWLAGIGTPLTVQFGDWQADPPLYQALIATYREYNITHHDDRVSPYPGAVELVRQLRGEGLKLGLVTSKNQIGARRGLQKLGLEDAIEVIVAAEDVIRPKPHPEPVTRALEALGSPAGDAIYVGDSLHDMHAGRAAGVATGAVLWGPFTREHLTPADPDYWLESPADVRRVVWGGSGTPLRI